MKVQKSRIVFGLLCGLLISFHLADMISTDVILKYGSSTAVEANPLAANAQGEGWKIATIRGITLIAVSLGLILFQPSEQEISKLRTLPLKKILFGKVSSIPNKIIIRIITFSCIVIISINRLIATISNISGEIFDISLTLIVERIFGFTDLSSIYLAATLFSATLSIIIFLVAWEFYRVLSQHRSSTKLK